MERVELSSPENLEAERALLWEIQLKHQEVLESTGIAEKALAHAHPDDINPLTKLAVTSWSKEINGEAMELMGIKLTTPQSAVAGEYVCSINRVSVADETQKNLDLRYDFTLDEAEIVAGMLGQLEFASDLGLLPHLSCDKTEILAPTRHDLKQTILPL